MKSLLFFGIAFCLITKLVNSLPKSADDKEWDNYKEEHKKCYTPKEDHLRRTIYFSRKGKIDDHNRDFKQGKQPYEQGINEFSDWTDEERGYLCAFIPSTAKKNYLSDSNLTQTTSNNTTTNPNATLSNSNTTTPRPSGGKRDVFVIATPTAVDWRAMGFVTPVQRQGLCGSSYAFSATGSIEGQWKKTKGTLPELSQQQLVDCSNRGCDGGSMAESFNYIKNAGGLAGSSAYPYTSGNGKYGTCKFSNNNLTSPNMQVLAKVSSYVDVRENDEALKTACRDNGPISVAICAQTNDFINYKSGIFSNNDCQTVDHAVLLVGYDEKNNWILRNSWGTGWGLNGYMLMSSNSTNMRGINSYASYPIVL